MPIGRRTTMVNRLMATGHDHDTSVAPVRFAAAGHPCRPFAGHPAGHPAGHQSIRTGSRPG